MVSQLDGVEMVKYVHQMKNDLNHGGENLKESQATPRPIVVNIHSSPCDPCDNYTPLNYDPKSNNGEPTQRTEVPETVVNSRNNSSVLRVADLRKENRGSHLGQTAAKAEDQPTSDIH